MFHSARTADAGRRKLIATMALAASFAIAGTGKCRSQTRNAEQEGVGRQLAGNRHVPARELAVRR